MDCHGVCVPCWTMTCIERDLTWPTVFPFVLFSLAWVALGMIEGVWLVAGV